MVDHILKIIRPGFFYIRCLSWNTAIIVSMKNAALIKDDIKVVTEFPCLLGHPVQSQLISKLFIKNSFASFPRRRYSANKTVLTPS